MIPTSKSDHVRASITLYCVIANAESKLGHTINRTRAAQALADLLQINNRASASWLRGDFKKHPISRENFLRFIRAYRTKPGLETVKEIAALAIDLYGQEYKKVIKLLDPADRESDPAQDVPVRLSGASDMTMTINNLCKFSSPEQIGIAFSTLTAYQWFIGNLFCKNLLM